MPTPSEIHQRGQSLLVTELVGSVRKAWLSLFDPQDIAVSGPKLSTALLALTRSYGQAASVHAADFYKQERASRVGGRFTVPLADPPKQEEVTKQVQWATSDLYKTSEPTPKASPSYDLTPYIIQPKSVDSTLTKIEGVATKIVLDQSRETLLGAVKKDAKAHGWARVPEQGACYFCLLLATRGAVYKSKESAGPNKRTNDSEGSIPFLGDGKYKVHDHCRCSVEPLFGNSYEMTSTVRSAQALYKASARSGPSDAVNNFRTALQRERDAGRFAG